MGALAGPYPSPNPSVPQEVSRWSHRRPRGVSYGAAKLQGRVVGVREDRLVGLSAKVEYVVDILTFIDLPFHDGLAHPFTIDLLSSYRDVSKSVERTDFLTLRKNTESRSIENLPEVVALLSDRAFSVLTGGDLSVEAQISTWRSARTVVSPLGSDLTNMVFGAQRVVALTPAWFGDRFFFNLAASLGVEWNELICTQMGVERKPLRNSNFKVDVGILATLL